MTAQSTYRRLRTNRPDWTAIEAARVAVAFPELSPRDNLGHSIPFADRELEAMAQALVADEDGGDQMEVVYEVTVYVPEDEPIPEEDALEGAISDRFPDVLGVAVKRY